MFYCTGAGGPTHVVNCSVIKLTLWTGNRNFVNTFYSETLNSFLLLKCCLTDKKSSLTLLSRRTMAVKLALGSILYKSFKNHWAIVLTQLDRKICIFTDKNTFKN